MSGLEIFESTATDDEKLLFACCGDQGAALFLKLLLRMCHIMDDLHDGDKPADVEELGWLWLDIQANPFFREHFYFLHPLMAAAHQDWCDANKLAFAHGQHGKAISWAIRESVANIVVHVARLVGGWEWSRRVGPVMRAHWIYDQAIDDYLKETSK